MKCRTLIPEATRSEPMQSQGDQTSTTVVTPHLPSLTIWIHLDSSPSSSSRSPTSPLYSCTVVGGSLRCSLNVQYTDSSCSELSPPTCSLVDLTDLEGGTHRCVMFPFIYQNNLLALFLHIFRLRLSFLLVLLQPSLPLLR